MQGKAPVEIRWSGVKGELLAVATPERNSISGPVRVPDVPPGVYSLMLVAPDGVARAALGVVGARSAAAPAATAQLWPRLTSSSGPSTVGPGGASPLGVALLGFGLVGLLAGSTVALVGRRRAPAAPNR